MSILKNFRFLLLLSFLIPFGVYLNTVSNEYALDDSLVITENMYVQKGIKGIKDIFSNDTFTGFFKKKKDLVEGGRYRPLSLVTFAIENNFQKNNPHGSHFINALLYSFLCVIIFCIFIKILNYLAPGLDALYPAFFGTLIFALHPIHTEVVANIKGRDELMSLLFALLSLYFFIKYFEKNKIIYPFISALSLFLALLSKESALTFIFIAGFLVLLNFKSKQIRQYLYAFFFLLAAFGLYAYIRFRVVGGFSSSGSGELLNNPFLNAKPGEKFPTILFTQLQYIKLVFFPHPLTFDYYPYHIRLHSWNDLTVILSLIINSFLIFFALYNCRRNKVIAFSVFLYYIALLPVSNLFINIGTFMNERFLFISSIGFALIAGYGFNILFQKFQSNPFFRWFPSGVLFIILVLFSIKTYSRNRVWKNNYSLFLHDVRISSGSAKSNCSAGGILLETSQNEINENKKQEMTDESIKYLTTALKIYPQYIDALLLLGNAYYRKENYENAITCYSGIFTQTSSYDLAFQNLKGILASTKDASQKIKGYYLILKYRPDDFDANYQMGLTYGKMLQKYDSARYYLYKAARLNPDHQEIYKDLGVAYAMNGEYQSSIQYFLKAIDIQPDDPSNYINLGITYQNLGKDNEALKLFQKAEALKQKQSLN